MIKILIVDDHEILRSGLKLILEQQTDFTVIGLAANGIEAYEFCKAEKPDIVMMDIRMEMMDGITSTKLIKEFDSNIKVLALTTFDHIEYIVKLIEVNIDGYILKAMPDEILFAAIRSVYSGLAVYDGKAKEGLRAYIKASKEANGADLSEKEMHVIDMICHGKSNREIAEQMQLAEGTVKNIISGIYGKLLVRDRLGLVNYVEENRLIEAWKVQSEL